MLIYNSTWNTGNDTKDRNKTNIVIVFERERQARKMVWQKHNQHEKWEYKILHMERNNLTTLLCARDIQLERNFAENNLGFVMDT